MNKKQRVAMAAVSACLLSATAGMPQILVFAQGAVQSGQRAIALPNGSYTININLLKENDDTASSAARYFTTEGASFIASDGTAKLQLRYSSPMIGEIAQISGNGETTLAVKEEGSEKYVELTVTSLTEEAVVSMAINTPIGAMKHKVRVQLDSSTLRPIHITVPDATASPSVKPEETQTPSATVAPTAKPESTQSPDVTASPSVKPEITPSQAPTQTPSGETVIADGTYEVKVYLWHATNNQASMAASAIDGTARLKVKNGVGTMYVYTKQMTMGTISAYLQELKIANSNGNYELAKVEAKDTKGNPTCFSFMLPSFEEYVAIKVNPHIAMMGNQDIDARLKVDYSTRKQVETEDVLNKPSEKPVVTEKPAATAKPVATTKPVTTEKPVVTTKPATTEKPATTTKPTATVNSTIVNEVVLTTQTPAATEEPEAVESEESTTESSEEPTTQPEAEMEEQHESLPATGGSEESNQPQQIESKPGNLPYVAVASACGASFLTSLFWALKLRFFH